MPKSRASNFNGITRDQSRLEAGSFGMNFMDIFSLLPFFAQSIQHNYKIVITKGLPNKFFSIFQQHKSSIWTTKEPQANRLKQRFCWNSVKKDFTDLPGTKADLVSPEHAARNVKHERFRKRRCRSRIRRRHCAPRPGFLFCTSAIFFLFPAKLYIRCSIFYLLRRAAKSDARADSVKFREAFTSF